MICLFLTLRVIGKTGRRIYATRCEVMKRFAPTFPPSPVELVKSVHDATEVYLLENVGLDAVMFLRFLKVSFQSISVIAGLLVPVILPINYSQKPANDPNDDNFFATGLARFSMANVESGSAWLWVHFFATYVVTFTLAYFLFVTYRDYVRLENEYLRQDLTVKNRTRHHELLQLRTIMVRDIPPELCTDEKLTEYFSNLGLGKVEFAVMNRLVDPGLQGMIRERDDALVKLEHAYMEWYQQRGTDEQASLLGKGARPRHRLSFFAKTDVDTIDFCTRRYMDLTAKILQTRKQALQLNEVNSTGFVTFETQQAAQIVSQVLLKYSSNPFTMTACLAPHPHDVDWDAFQSNLEQKQMRGFVVGVCVFFITFFWGIPVGFISSFTSLSSLGKVPWIKPILDKLLQVEWMAVFIETLLPPLLFRVFLALVPSIMQLLASFQGIEARSWKELAVFDKLYAFMLFNVLFVFALSSAAFTLIGDTFDNPISIINLLGTVLPKGAGFFTNYVIYSSGFFAWELGRPWIAVHHWFRSTLCTTPRDFYTLNRETSFMDFGIHYPYHVIILVICIVYSVQAPIVLLAGMAYFGFGYFVYKHQLLFVYVKEWENYGRHWPMIFNRVVWGMFIFQAVMMGLLGVKSAPVLAVLLIPLILLTYAFYDYCNVAFGPRSRFVPLDQLAPLVTERMDGPLDPLDRLGDSMQVYVAPTTPSAKVKMRAFTGEQGVVGMSRHSFYVNPALSSDLPNPWLPARVVASLPPDDNLAEMVDQEEQTEAVGLNGEAELEAEAEAEALLDGEDLNYQTPIVGRKDIG
jgi:hypothetical protein